LGALREPRPFAWSGKGRVYEAIRCRQLQPIVIRRTSTTGAFSAPRMRTPRGPSRTLWSLHRTTSTSDVPIVARRHVRVGFRIRPIRCPSKPTTLRSLKKKGVDLRARGLCFGLPVRARRAEARERLPSYREAASFYTCSPLMKRTVCSLHSRAPFRLLSMRAPRQAVLRTSSWLAPSVHQQVLRPPGGEDARCVQPTSATQSNCVHPHLVCSRLALATFAAREAHGE